MDRLDRQPAVSVIVPTFNQGAFILEAVESVLRQSFSDLEVIVVDNGSTDTTPDVLKQITDARVTVCCCENTGTVAAPRNYGVRQARGELLAFLDSDDVWADGKLSAQVGHLTDRGLSGVGSNFVPIGDTDYARDHLRFASSTVYRDYSFSEIVLANPIMTSSVLVRRADFCAEGGFDERPKFAFVEDWELWLRMSQHGKFRILTKPLLHYRVQTGRSRDVRAVSLGTLSIMEKLHGLGALDGRLLRMARANCNIGIGRAFLAAGDRHAIRYYVKGLPASTGWRNRARAVAGILLSALPKRLSESLLTWYYEGPLKGRP